MERTGNPYSLRARTLWQQLSDTSFASPSFGGILRLWVYWNRLAIAHDRWNFERRGR